MGFPASAPLFAISFNRSLQFSNRCKKGSYWALVLGVPGYNMRKTATLAVLGFFNVCWLRSQRLRNINYFPFNTSQAILLCYLISIIIEPSLTNIAITQIFQRNLIFNLKVVKILQALLFKATRPITCCCTGLIFST